MLRTWDIFDTLIARRCISPHPVFEIVERISKVNNFAKYRKTAEGNLLKLGTTFKLDDIYEEYQKVTGLPKDVCDSLKKKECDVELEQCIPITENIRQVKAGDVLISDMYLPDEVVRKMLHKAGLLVPVEILIGTRLKSSGRIWRQFSNQKISVFHTGDNELSDLVNPRLSNLDSTMDFRSRLTPAEKFLVQHDKDFTAWLREIRLRNPYYDEVKRLYWNFFTLNVGILTFFVGIIDDLQKKYGFEYLGFCGRDTFYMQLLYERYKSDIGEEPVPNDYIHYSRKLLKNSPDETKKYFQAKIKNRKALLIDFLGTGNALNKFRTDSEDLNYSILICCHYGKKFSENYYKPYSVKKAISFFDNPDEPEESNSIFYLVGYQADEPSYTGLSNEVFNRSTYNSPIRLSLIQVDKEILPIVSFSQYNDTENADIFEACFNEVLNSKIYWTALRQKDVLTQLLKIFKEQTQNKIFLERQSLEGYMNGLVKKHQPK